MAAIIIGITVYSSDIRYETGGYDATLTITSVCRTQLGLQL